MHQVYIMQPRMRTYGSRHHGMTSTASTGTSTSTRDVWMRSNCASAVSERASSASFTSREREKDSNSNEKGSGTHTKRKKPFLIGVAGGTASGKTCLCTEIVKQLSSDAGKSLSSSSSTSMAAATQSTMTMVGTNRTIVNISQDCFYRDLTQEERYAQYSMTSRCEAIHCSSRNH